MYPLIGLEKDKKIAYFRDNHNIIKITTDNLKLISEIPYDLQYCDYSVSQFKVINIEKIIENNNKSTYEINKEYYENKIVYVSYEKVYMLSCFDIPYNIIYNINYKNWYPNGQICEIYFNKSGLIDGKYIAYYNNGNIKIEGNYQNGYKQGKYKYYRQDGTLYYISNYVNNIKNEKKIYYDTNGNITEVFVYK